MCSSPATFWDWRAGKWQRDEKEKTVVCERKREREREGEGAEARTRIRVDFLARGSSCRLFLSLTLSLFPFLSRWFEDLRKTWSRTSECSPYLCTRAQGLRTAEKRTVGSISTPDVRQRRFISEDPSLCPSPLPSISFKPPTVALGFSSFSAICLSLFFLNLAFYLVMLLSRNMILLYSTSCTAFCYYGEVPIDVAVKVTKNWFLSAEKSLYRLAPEKLDKYKGLQIFSSIPCVRDHVLIARSKKIFVNFRPIQIKLES